MVIRGGAFIKCLGYIFFFFNSLIFSKSYHINLSLFHVTLSNISKSTGPTELIFAILACYANTNIHIPKIVGLTFYLFGVI